jgi:catechol 2,3-dioxygenase-like lactoylglutathione lyase family enzyme
MSPHNHVDGPAAPILPVRDVAKTLAFFDRLGFTTSRYDDGYGFAQRDLIDLHFSQRKDLDPSTEAGSCYINVADVDALYDEFRRADVWHVQVPMTSADHDELERRWRDGASIARIADVTEKPWGTLEFELMDPSNNLLRFGRDGGRTTT